MCNLITHVHLLVHVIPFLQSQTHILHAWNYCLQKVVITPVSAGEIFLKVTQKSNGLLSIKVNMK